MQRTPIDRPRWAGCSGGSNALGSTEVLAGAKSSTDVERRGY